MDNDKNIILLFDNITMLREKYHNKCETTSNSDDYEFWRGAYNAADSCQRELLEVYKDNEILLDHVRNMKWQV